MRAFAIIEDRYARTDETTTLIGKIANFCALQNHQDL